MNVVTDYFEQLADVITSQEAREPLGPYYSLNRTSGIAEVMQLTIPLLDSVHADELMSMCKAWLFGDDFCRVAVVICLKENCPLKDIDEIDTEAARITERWPFLKSACNEWIAFAMKSEET